MIPERDIQGLTCDAYNDDPTRVRRVAMHMPPSFAFDDAARLLKAIADPVRVRILYALTREPLCVCELATLLDMSMPAVSHHLRLLTMGGLLTVRKEGKFACYHIQERHLEGVIGELLGDLERSKEVAA